MPQIESFFAVTLSGSLYLVTSEKDKTGTPIVAKIAMKNGVKSGMALGEKLQNGEFVGITRICITVYYSDIKGSRPRPEKVNLTLWGGNTSPVVGLFLSGEDARACLQEENLAVLDRRWAINTREVLSAIGDAHPVFVICKNPSEFSFDEIMSA
ncbi:MAG: hypothetical protein Q7R94_03055 [bacterium]|nr:hypothetical protein [bacterium]